MESTGEGFFCLKLSKKKAVYSRSASVNGASSADCPKSSSAVRHGPAPEDCHIPDIAIHSIA